jgi:hypothetical protein
VGPAMIASDSAVNPRALMADQEPVLHIGIFPRSFRLHGTHHAREKIVEICSMWDASRRRSLLGQAPIVRRW